MTHASRFIWMCTLALAAACGGDLGVGTAGGIDGGHGDPFGDDPGDGGAAPGWGPEDPGGEPEDEPGPDPAALAATWDSDPCLAPYQPPAGYELVLGTDGDDVIDLSNKPGSQMIVAGAGNDTIYAGPGDDIVCAGSGRDLVFGQAGNDYIDGGYANDELHGNNGHDVIHGRAGSDTIYGEGGWDLLFGDLLDDRIFGGDGNDLLVGGHGTDFMHGGPGDDWLRGDTNGDQLVGGVGFDVASFATATPPGQAGFGPNPPPGIDADLALSGQSCLGKNPENLDTDINYPGCAWGDGRDGLMGIDAIVGSSFDDRMAGGPGASVFYGGYGNDTFLSLDASDQVDGGPGQDSCNGAPCDGAAEEALALPAVFVQPDPIDLGLVFLGGEGDDVVAIERNGGQVRVTSQNGQPLSAGAFCNFPNPADHGVVDCDIPHTLRYVLAWGGGGNDTISIGDGFPRDFTAYLDGGPGDDVLHGGAGQDCMLAGESGHDQLFGNGGDDALITESTDGDLLSGGEGNDQLVTNYPCGGHHYQGGPGQDIAGFARVGTNYRVWAQLGGNVQNPSPFHGRALSPGTCSSNPAQWTILDPGLEILEGGSLNDRLYGNDGPNIIWARDGNDEVRGYGGGDIILGGPGNDEIHGGPGQDIIRSGAGFDWIHVKDDTPEHVISCGANGGKLESADPFDPTQGSGCNP